MEYLKQLFKNVADFIGRMAPGQVMMLIGVVAGTIVGAIFLFGWINDVRYARLYSNLDNTEASDVVAHLQDSGIPFKLTDGGSAVEVPSDKVYETRIALASEGLPRSGTVGYSIFDENNLGMTDFLQNLNFRRALEGELTRTIMQMNEVQAARVHIVIPKERLFKQDQREATASVVVKLTGGRSLSAVQVNGITHLVASSVEGLDPGNITIVDYDGNLLSSGRDRDELAGLSSSQLEVRKNVEGYLEDKAQSMLDEVLGSGKSIVRVTAELDFQQLERTSEQYDPNSPAIRSEERSKSTTAASDKAEETSESTNEQNNETTITNYELNKTVEHIVNAVGNVSRLSVAVMVDGTYEETEGEGGSTEMLYQPRSQEELDRLAGIVRNSVGFDPQRNDQIEMVNIAFDRQNLEHDRDALDSMYLREFYLDIGEKVGLVALLIFLLLWARKRVRRLGASMAKLLPQKPPTPPPPPTPAAAAEEEEAPPVEVEKRKPRLVDQLQRTAKDRPDEIARVIKTIMIE